MREARRRALSLCQAGLFEQGLQQAEQALRDDDQDAFAWCIAAWALSSLRRPQASLDAAEQALRLQPERDWPHRVRATALRTLGRRREAEAAAREAIRISPDQAVPWVMLAEIMLAIDAAEAAEAATRATALAPENQFAWVLLGQACMRQDDFDGAEGAYRQALSIAPDAPYAMNALAWLLLRKEKYEEALDLFERAIRSHPSWPAPMYNRATVIGHQRGHAAGAAAHRQALQLAAALTDQQIAASPHEGVLYCDRAFILARQGKGTDALEAARLAVRLAPESAVCWRSLAWAAAGLGRFRLARYAIARSAEFDPTVPGRWFECAEIAFLADRPDDVRSWTGKIINNASETSFRPRAEAMVAYCDGEYALATSLASEGTRDAPFNCCAQTFLAICCIQAGDAEGSQAAADAAEFRAPGCPCGWRDNLHRLLENRARSHE